MIITSSLLTYPIKSAGKISHEEIFVNELGLEGDRLWAVIGDNGKCLTARDCPILLRVKVAIEKDRLEIIYNGSIVRHAALQPDRNQSSLQFGIHSYTGFGFFVNIEIDQWFSALVGQSCRFVRHNPEKHRPVLEKHGGVNSDVVAFADQAPILIVSEESLSDLNSRMETPLNMDRFRPNIVINGCKPYAEDTWTTITIGSCKLKIIQACERCVMTTIDPNTLAKSKSAEPLRTLSKYRIGPRGGCIFGAHAVVIKPGLIKAGDTIEIH